jgi:hypothetical protein
VTIVPHKPIPTIDNNIRIIPCKTMDLLLSENVDLFLIMNTPYENKG